MSDQRVTYSELHLAKGADRQQVRPKGGKSSSLETPQGVTYAELHLAKGADRQQVRPKGGKSSSPETPQDVTYVELTLHGAARAPQENCKSRHCTGSAAPPEKLVAGLLGLACLVLMCGVIGAVMASHCGPCPEGWVSYSNNCYYFSAEKKTWSESVRACESKNAQLLYVESEQELVGMSYSPAPPEKLLAGFLGLCCLVLVCRIGALMAYADEESLLTPDSGKLIVLSNNSQSHSASHCGPCPEGWVSYSNNCYYFSAETKSWSESVRACESKNAQLLYVESEQELVSLHVCELCTCPAHSVSLVGEVMHVQLWTLSLSWPCPWGRPAPAHGTLLSGDNGPAVPLQGFLKSISALSWTGVYRSGRAAHSGWSFPRGCRDPHSVSDTQRRWRGLLASARPPVSALAAPSALALQSPRTCVRMGGRGPMPPSRRQSRSWTQGHGPGQVRLRVPAQGSPLCGLGDEDRPRAPLWGRSWVTRCSEEQVMPAGLGGGRGLGQVRVLFPETQARPGGSLGLRGSSPCVTRVRGPCLSFRVSVSSCRFCPADSPLPRAQVAAEVMGIIGLVLVSTVIQLHVLISDNPSTAHHCVDPCPEGWVMFSGSCYYVSTESRTWRESEAACAAESSSLLHADNQAEMEFLSIFPVSSWVDLARSTHDNSHMWPVSSDFSTNIIVRYDIIVRTLQFRYCPHGPSPTQPPPSQPQSQTLRLSQKMNHGEASQSLQLTGTEALSSELLRSGQHPAHPPCSCLCQPEKPAPGSRRESPALPCVPTASHSKLAAVPTREHRDRPSSADQSRTVTTGDHVPCARVSLRRPVWRLSHTDALTGSGSQQRGSQRGWKSGGTDWAPGVGHEGEQSRSDDHGAAGGQKVNKCLRAVVSTSCVPSPKSTLRTPACAVTSVTTENLSDLVTGTSRTFNLLDKDHEEETTETLKYDFCHFASRAQGLARDRSGLLSEYASAAGLTGTTLVERPGPHIVSLLSEYAPRSLRTPPAQARSPAVRLPTSDAACRAFPTCAVQSAPCPRWGRKDFRRDARAAHLHRVSLSSLRPAAVLSSVCYLPSSSDHRAAPGAQAAEMSDQRVTYSELHLAKGADRQQVRPKGGKSSSLETPQGVTYAELHLAKGADRQQVKTKGGKTSSPETTQGVTYAELTLHGASRAPQDNRKSRHCTGETGVDTVRGHAWAGGEQRKGMS
ncbi:NKG2-A/NKG2-B type II integral membrane protein [Galemys pyrenaicus]|uniref:NKG2-A/NKG2-B type II integral membrane protein n=1 Tax=Galemys pyrenaicus TaxID=202257 RepID=A0A8J6A082_GALPY|nr:NKG2-A/NKG2-B type II integral membrane protein [Galemys pyrenaicus]